MKGGNRLRWWLGLSVVVMLAFAAPHANATLYTFDNITNNNATNAAIGEAQLFVEVLSYAPGQVLFKFLNIGLAACSITDVYFDNGNPAETFLNLAGLIDRDDGVGGHNGVDFTPPAVPSNLPGGSAVGFQVTTGFSADSDSPIQARGVNPGEWLGVVFNLLSGKTFADVLADIADGDLRIGIHVQGFRNGGSESFVNNGVVPEPATVGLLAAGLLSLAAGRRRRIA
ncbi:MAG: hypothetical protein GHCLOJNM_02770 [bacterium]|nr:hypothetical protein [bacterium]